MPRSVTDVSCYDFSLPADLIAQAPVEPRDASRLLVLHRESGRLEHRRFVELPEYLGPGDLLVANNTRVMRARLLGKRVSADGAGGRVEFLLLEEREPLLWEGAFHASAKAKPGLQFEIPMPSGGVLRGEIVQGASESPSGTVLARFDRDPTLAGELPLPPYITRSPDDADHERYQTVYARLDQAGMRSAAAPTAGLHFTPRVRDAIAARGAGWTEVTLHVGLGTFRPVKAQDIREHVMHEERYEISEKTADPINAHRSTGGRVVAVGTTAVRTLESAWDGRNVRAGQASTGIFLYPGKKFHVVGGLLTNFHLPRSTLLMLVCAFGGTDRVLAAYESAVREKYRFYSYGDAMLIV